MKWLLFILFVLIFFFGAVIACDCNRFVIRSYKLSSNKIKKNIKLVLLTDLHSVSFGRDNYKLKKAIRDINPDAVLVAGDMYTSNVGESTDIAYDLVKYIAEKYPVYYANGNHEQKTKEETGEFGTTYIDYKNSLLSLDVKYLENDSTYLSDYNIRIFGLETPFKYYRKFLKLNIEKDELNSLIGKACENEFNLLIAHNPEYFSDYAGWGADLTVSGHVHGGLMRLPLIGGVISPKLTLFPKYSGGEYTIDDKKLVLSCGLGTHTLPIRIFNPGEVSVVEIISVSDVQS